MWFADFCVAGVDAWWAMSGFAWLWCEANLADGEVARFKCMYGCNRSREAAPVAHGAKEVLGGLFHSRAGQPWK